MEGAAQATPNNSVCDYMGTEHMPVKIWLIGVFAVSVCALSVLFNTFFAIVFSMQPTLRTSPVYYFGILAFIDILMAVNYVAAMAVPVYMDYHESLPMYHMFLSYFRVVLAESNIAIFASMLLIVVATTERLLRTFHGANTKAIRKLSRAMEKRRPLVCIVCILISVAYKTCTYFEVTYIEHENCTDFSRYEIAAGFFTLNADYKFWWMFITRNIVDRIAPFFTLVTMNFLIVKALRDEYHKNVGKTDAETAIQKAHNPTKNSLRDATSSLVILVTMYLLSQTLQVIITFWETINRTQLENELVEFYSYMNDIICIMPLIASCTRYPSYLICNEQIREASKDTIRSFNHFFKLERFHYIMIRKETTSTNNNDHKYMPSAEIKEHTVAVATMDDYCSSNSEEEWRL